MSHRTRAVLLAGALIALVLPAVAQAATRPANLTAPTISATAAVGSTLTASKGTWSNSPTSYSYSWRRCDSAGASCVAISGATATTYKLVSADAGHRMRVLVTARNAAGSASKRSAATDVVTTPAAPAPDPTPTPSPTPSTGLHVSGNKLLNDAGQQVLFHGVNVSGSEYACIQGWGIFDGPVDDAAVQAIRSWNSNVVRVLLNEDCWLGINGVPAAYSGANYRNAITDFVKRIEAHGMYAEVSLMWGAPGTQKATYQPAAPDADHSPAMWASMAQTFKGDPNVVLAPWGESTVSADCFLKGGNCGADFNGTPYTSAGMQQAVDTFRSNGWTGPIVIPGITYANDLTQWLSHKPSDPLNQLMAEAHIYGKNACGTTACMDSQYAPVAAQVPLILGEFGETYDDSSAGSTNSTAFMNWSDAHDVGYEAWTWDVWGTYGSLISNTDGTPNGAYGNAVRSHFLARP